MFGTCLSSARDDLPASARLLLSEYIRFALHRGLGCYPESLPVDALAARFGTVVSRVQSPCPWKICKMAGDEVEDRSGKKMMRTGMAMAFATRHYRHLTAPRSL